MSAATSILGRSGERLGEFLPQLAAAIALLLVGLLVAHIVGRLVRRALLAAGVDDVAERWGVSETLSRARLSPSVATVVGAAVRILLSAVVVVAAVMLLGLAPLSEALNAAVLFLPNLLVALVLLLAGVVVGGFARESVDRLTYQMDFPVPLGNLTQIAVLAIFAITAAAQIGVSSEVLTAVIVIVLAGAASTFAIAFGLGGREVARALNASRFVRAAFTVGQTIQVGDVRGEIVAFDADATVIGTNDGRVRVPNHLLIESIVRVYGGPPQS
jgi:hypothetical protein